MSKSLSILRSRGRWQCHPGMPDTLWSMQHTIIVSFEDFPRCNDVVLISGSAYLATVVSGRNLRHTGDKLVDGFAVEQATPSASPTWNFVSSMLRGAAAVPHSKPGTRRQGVAVQFHRRSAESQSRCRCVQAFEGKWMRQISLRSSFIAP
jgi:hypothetical protein